MRATTRAVIGHPANRGRRLRAMARVAGWQVWERVVRRPLSVPFEGMELVCFPHEHSSSAVIYNRLPDWEEMHFVRRFLRAGDTFVDVGANVGVYTLLAASVDGVSVVAFEPSTHAFNCLGVNIDRNGLHHRVSAHRAAAGATAGRAVLTVDRGTMNRLSESDSSGEQVEVVRLDDVPLSNPTLVKIDVEGFELDVLRGAESTIDEHHPVLLVEANDPDALSQWCQAHGYRTFRFDLARGQLVDCEAGEAANVFAVFDVERATARLS